MPSGWWDPRLRRFLLLFLSFLWSPHVPCGKYDQSERRQILFDLFSLRIASFHYNIETLQTVAVRGVAYCVVNALQFQCWQPCTQHMHKCFRFSRHPFEYARQESAQERLSIPSSLPSSFSIIIIDCAPSRGKFGKWWIPNFFFVCTCVEICSNGPKFPSFWTFLSEDVGLRVFTQPWEF